MVAAGTLLNTCVKKELEVYLVWQLYSTSFQVIKRITDGGTDYSFECIGDTGMITTALQSCCDVILWISQVYAS